LFKKIIIIYILLFTSKQVFIGGNVRFYYDNNYIDFPKSLLEIDNLKNVE
jgi:hypothetical protein